MRIGCLVTTAGRALTRLIDEFSALNPNCQVTLNVVETRNPYASLRCGDIDVLVSYLVVQPDLTTGPVIEYRDRVLHTGCRHRLVGVESVSVEDLGDEEVHQNAPGYQKGTRLLVSEDAKAPTELAKRFEVFRPTQLSLAAGDRIRITAGGKTKDGHRLSNGSLLTVGGFNSRGDIVVDHGWDSSVFTGSFNATAHALEHNVEFMVELVGKRSRFGVDQFLRYDEKRNPLYAWR